MIDSREVFSMGTFTRELKTNQKKKEADTTQRTYKEYIRAQWHDSNSNRVKSLLKTDKQEKKKIMKCHVN